MKRPPTNPGSFLQPSAYEISASAKGFKETVRPRVDVQISQPVRLEMELAVGQVTERIEVSAGASTLNTVSSEIGYSAGEEVLANLSLVNGGGRPVTNEMLAYGVPTTNVSDQTYTFTPSPESLGEFKLLTVPFSAEYGHTGGGGVALSSKSGGNDYHGIVFDFFRNRILNARAPFQGDLTQKYVQNNPGGNIGGPVRLPLYHPHRKRPPRSRPLPR